MPRIFTLQLFAAIFIVLIISGCPNPTRKLPIITPVGAISGTIYSDSRALTIVKSRAAQPLANALVRVHGTDLSTTSNANGEFLLTNIPIGAQTIIISASGYQAISIPVTIVENQIQPITALPLTSTSAKWTVLVYMNTDNNLEYYGIQDVNEMESVATSSQVNVAVMMDRAPEFDSSNGDWTGTKRFKIVNDNNPSLMTSTTNSPVLEDMGEMDMGLPATLRDFIAWGKSTFPAEHYALVIWNHGNGWRVQSAETALTRSISFDDSSGHYISTADLSSALQSPAPLDIVSFDACLMQMLEVAYQIRGKSDIIVASEENVPGDGYPYNRLLAPLVANPAMTPAGFATVMTRESLSNYGTSSDVTFSAISVAKMPQLMTALNDFSAQLIKVANSKKSDLASARDTTESFGGSYYADYKDLQHYAQLVKAKVNVSAVKSSADTLIKAVDDCTIANYHGNWHPNANGISIYIPNKINYERLKPNYDLLDFANNSQWDNWLAAQRD